MSFGSNAKQNIRDYGQPKPWIDWNEGPVRGVIISEEQCATVKFVQGQGTVAASKKDDGKFRFATLFWDKDENIVKKLEGPQRLYDALMNFGKRVDISKAVIEIERTGSGPSTKYEVVGVGTVDAADEANIAAAEKPDLVALCKWLPQPASRPGEDYAGDNGEIPFGGDEDL